jgi:S-adenosylmethionine:tRNA ribosyltransferase-isomerase
MSEDTLVQSYDFVLPEELIAQRPVDSFDRAQSKLLVYNCKTEEVTHDHFYNIGKYLPKNSTLVFNQSKVFPSRLIGQKPSGGKAELFFLSIEPKENAYEVLLKTRSKKSIGDEFLFADEFKVRVEKIFEQGTFGVSIVLPSNFSSLMSYLEKNALIPIPPYIRKGESDEQDKKDYQTVYSKDVGSVAAPTAGLHFTNKLLENLNNEGMKTAYVTLHVGLGTFKPVMTDKLEEHVMHEETYLIDSGNYKKIKSSENIFAVGTTSLRVLESSRKNSNFTVDHFQQTSIFLHPGVEVESIQGLVTNFHLPKSTLLMLVSSLIGRKKTLELYNIAVEKKYRFFSYGDGMLIIR